MSERESPYHRLSIEVRNLTLRLEVFQIILSESLNFIGRQEPQISERLNKHIVAAFARHMETRAEEERAILRVAFGDLVKPLS